MDKAKIRLSEKEAELVANTDWILTKNEILQKVKYLLGDLHSQQQIYLNTKTSVLPAEVTIKPAKISRGENYQGLPYLVLDYPRYFGRDDRFAIRTMFWWGNFFSVTLHLAGRYKKIYESKIESSFKALNEDSFFINVNDEQWEHHFESGNYVSLKEMNDQIFRTSIRQKGFIKQAKKIPVQQWNDAEEVLFNSFCKLIGCLAG